MRIDVTQEDVDGGVPLDCESCPVALALRAATGQPVVRVGRVVFRAGPHRGVLPRQVQQFVFDFDHGKTVAPFSFELNLSKE